MSLIFYFANLYRRCGAVTLLGRGVVKLSRRKHFASDFLIGDFTDDLLHCLTMIFLSGISPICLLHCLTMIFFIGDFTDLSFTLFDNDINRGFHRFVFYIV